MTIEAYLDPEEDKVVQDIEELTPEAYKGLAQTLSIDKAEQAIIDEIAGVDGDDEENEKEELENERDMKTLFESLYDIDPDTKEVFVKGSAYDLKKWEDDMVCFAFGDPERVVAMEAAISPAEHSLTRAYEKINQKRTALAGLIRQHNVALRAKTISKAFAKDFQQVMGYPIPNIRMESFTTEPSTTNYAIAMEEMNAQQAALVAGGALVGIGIVYKLIQWFSKSLNKNGEAVSAISTNFSNYKERKEKIETAIADLQLDKQKVDGVVENLVEEFTKTDAQDPAGAVAELKNAANLAPLELNKRLQASFFRQNMQGRLNNFHVAALNGTVQDRWWKTLSQVASEGLTALDSLVAALEKVSDSNELEKGKPDPINFKFLEALNALKIKDLLPSGQLNYIPYDKTTDNWEESINSFMAIVQSLNTPLATLKGVDFTPFKFDALVNIEVETFNQLSSNKIEALEKGAAKLKDEATRAYQDMSNTGNKKDARVENRRDRVNLLAKEFKAVANVIRFIIQVRNHLGTLSVALDYSTQRSIGFWEKVGADIKSISNKVSDAVTSVNRGLSGK